MQRIYLDNAASTPLSPAVREAMEPFLGESFGNPSAAHRLGVEAAAAIDAARELVAKATGSRASEVVFTSGGTEANNLAVLGGSRARKELGRHLIVGPTEHASVRKAALALEDEGFEVEFARLDAEGALDLDHFAELLRPDTVLVAQMLVSNEFGSVYPVRQLARLTRARAPHALVHVDAVQGLGKRELSLGELGCDTLSVSAHKVHGPKGTGALIVRDGVQLAPILHGGPQERGLRAGTENPAGIAGFGRAAADAAAARPATIARFTRMRARFCELLDRLPGAKLLEPGTPRQEIMPGIITTFLPGVPASVRLHHLDQAGVLASAGAACNAKRKDVNPALLAAGLDAEDSRRVLRFSLASSTTDEELDAALRVIEVVHQQLQAVRS
ncbi:MAG: cysteine desulfurase [Planctomycetes bacterium]|nr:cysteine desulfurase [Planctomycetota bacterium]